MTQQPQPGYRERIDRPGPKRLLALDGGGIRGVITLEILERLEQLLAAAHGKPADEFRLADYFDYVGGTSTGAIIATGISLGMSVAQIRRFYTEGARTMFKRSSPLKWLQARNTDANLAAMLRQVCGTMTFGDERLRTLLLLVMRNATTDSPWPLSNNPRAKYSDPDRPDSNLKLPLWQLVRASTAAPVHFPPEVITVGERRFIFVDGAVTVYNNPAFLLYLMATLKEYRLEWPAGEDHLLLVSVGTGLSEAPNANLRPDQMHLLYNATKLPSALIFAAATEQDMLCRVFGRCRFGAPIDREIGALLDDRPGKAFTYVRYNPDLSAEGLDALGLGAIPPRNVQRLDSVLHVEAMQAVGRAYARQVAPEHLGTFFPAPRTAP
jgi:uncharacterized protein